MAYGSRQRTRRRLETCVSNFYPIHFQEPGDVYTHIRIFHLYFSEEVVDGLRPLRAREETELKRQIFEVPRREGRQRCIEDALGVRHLVFGGDSAAGISSSRWLTPLDSPSLSAAPSAGPSTGTGAPTARHQVPDAPGVDESDRWEVRHSNAWMPAVARQLLPDGQVSAEVYEPGSFWSEGRRLAGPSVFPLTAFRPRQWAVPRGELLRVPLGETLVLGRGQRLEVEARGATAEEPAGRLVLPPGASVQSQGGSVQNEGVLECSIELAAGARRFRLEFHCIKEILVECLGDVPRLPQEERAAALQCFAWVFERSYRNLQYSTLGGRGYYRLQRPEAVRQRESYLARRGADRQLGPLAWLYQGCAASPVQVSHGPCLKVDLSIRIVQNQTVLERCLLLCQAVRAERRAGGLDCTGRDIDEFLQSQLVGRTCMTTHQDAHYRIQRVCMEKRPTDTFPFEGRSVTFVEYFRSRYGIEDLPTNQPLLHIPRRGCEGRYLPASLAYLTGLEEEQRSSPAVMQEVTKHLHKRPAEHWQEQARLVGGLAGEARPGGLLHEWGISVERQPLEVPCVELAHEPVYFSPEAGEFLARGEPPPRRLAVATELPNGRVAFERRPWPDVWTGERGLLLDRWLVLHAEPQRQLAEVLREDVRPLARELVAAAGGRLQVGEPELVSVPADSARAWLAFLSGYTPPWGWRDTRFAVVILPEQMPRGGQWYSQLKQRLTFLAAVEGMPTQMVLSGTLQRTTQRRQILRNVVQQVLVKLGAWLWVSSPLVHRVEEVMAIGIDACKQYGAPAVQTLCASTNRFFTAFHTTWRIRREIAKTGVFMCSPGDMVREALCKFFELHNRLPDALVVYRGGVSESHEPALLEREVHAEGGLVPAVRAAAEELGWRRPVELAFVLVRRGTRARFMTQDEENLPSGTCISERVVAVRDDPRQYDFYMVSQSFVAATARPTLYSVLHNTSPLTPPEMKQFTYQLCGLYMTFSGLVATPAPLKYATELLGFLASCGDVPPEPRSDTPGDWLRSHLFFV